MPKLRLATWVTPYPLNLPIRKPIYSTGAMARVWGGDGDMLQLAVPRCVHFNVFYTFAYTLSRSFECTNTFQKACQQDFLKNAIYTMHRSGMVNSTFQLESTSMDLWCIINMMYLQGVFAVKSPKVCAVGIIEGNTNWGTPWNGMFRPIFFNDAPFVYI